MVMMIDKKIEKNEQNHNGVDELSLRHLLPYDTFRIHMIPFNVPCTDNQ